MPELTSTNNLLKIAPPSGWAPNIYIAVVLAFT
jgi:hypothetical protein